MLAQHFSTSLPWRSLSRCRGVKHPGLFPKQSGEEFDKNFNPRCSAPTTFLLLRFEPWMPGSVISPIATQG